MYAVIIVTADNELQSNYKALLFYHSPKILSGIQNAQPLIIGQDILTQHQFRKHA